MLDELICVMEIKTQKNGETVFEIGSEGDLFYFILEGAVEIRIPDFDKKLDF